MELQETTLGVCCIAYHDTYGDPCLQEDYGMLENFLKLNKDDIHIVFESDEFGVYQFDSRFRQTLKAFLSKTTFDVDIYHDVDEMAEQLECEAQEVVSAYDYHLKMLRLVKESDGDDREFQRLWTEEFVLN